MSWMKEYPGDYIISDKLDGASALMTFRPFTIQQNGSIEAATN